MGRDKKTGTHAPFTHDLRRLAKFSGLILEDDYNKWLDIITTFNLNQYCPTKFQQVTATRLYYFIYFNFLQSGRC